MGRIHFVPVVALMLSALIFTRGQSSQAGTQAGQTASRNPPVKAKRYW